MQKKGISLIVLVITIIVMIILAATVVISLTSNSVIDRANQAVQLTDEKQVQDLAAIVWSEMYIDEYRDDELRREVMEKLVEQGVDTNKYHIVVSNTGVSVSTTSTKVTTLAGTKWKFNEHISDYDFLEVFDYDEQTGWDEFPDGATISEGTYTIAMYGFTIGVGYGVKVFGPVHSSGDDYVFWYVPGDEIGIPNNWYRASDEIEQKVLLGQITSMEELIEGLVKIDSPTISFGNESNPAVTNPELIDWLYENATKIG